MELEQVLKEADEKAKDSSALEKAMQGLKEKLASNRKYFAGYIEQQETIREYGISMVKAMEYSQAARNICIAVDEGKESASEFKLAFQVCERAIKLLDGVMIVYPNARGAIMPMKQKILKQCKEIQTAILEIQEVIE